MAVLCRLRNIFASWDIGKIGLLSGRFSPQVSEARIEGFVKTLAKYDIPVDDRFIADIEPALEDGEEIMTRMLREVDAPHSFFLHQ